VTAADLREEITRRGWWILKHYGRDRPDSGNLRCIDAYVGEWRIRQYVMGDDHKQDYFMIFLLEGRDGRSQLEFDSVPNRGRNPDYDEWGRIIEAFRKLMVLEDLAEL